jgi:hypothetical protein
MTDAELKELLANLIHSQQEIGRHLDESIKEAEKRSQETNKQFKKTDKKLKELAKQIGGLGNKFGSFTEGMAFPALDKLLRRRFGMEVVTTRTRAKRNGALMELDVFAYAPEGEVVIVEVKSHLRAEDIEQIVQILTEFPKFFPQYANYPRYGMLAAVDIAESLRQQVLKAGIYLATINDDQFTLQVPESFRAKSFW